MSISKPLDAIDHYNLQAIDSSELLILSNDWTFDMEQLPNIRIRD